MLSHHLSAVNSHFAWFRHHSVCVIMQLLYGGCVPPRRPGAVSSVTQPSRWLLAKRLSLAFYSISRSLTQQIHTQDSLHPPAPTHHTRDCTHTTLPQLQAPGGSAERQCRHCVSLYYTWNSGASCIFNWRNLHRRHACQCELCQWGRLRPAIYIHTATAPPTTKNHKALRGRIAEFLPRFQFKITHSYWRGGAVLRDCAALAPIER